MYEKQEIEKMIQDFSEFAKNMLQKRKNVKLTTPFVQVVDNEDEADGTILQNTGAFSPEENKIYVFVNGRGIGDILRSFAHELVHSMQMQIGDITEDDLQTFSEDGDVTTNQKLWDIEEEANGLGGMLFRAYKDHIKKKMKNKKIKMREGFSLGFKHALSLLDEGNIFDLYSAYLKKDKEKEERIREKEKKEEELIKKYGKNKKEIKNTIKIIRKNEEDEKKYGEDSFEHMEELAQELSRAENRSSYAVAEKIREFHILFMKYFGSLFEDHGYEKTENSIKGDVYEFAKQQNKSFISFTIYPLGIQNYYERGESNLSFDKPICSVVLKSKKEETVIDFDFNSLKSMYKKIKKIIK